MFTKYAMAGAFSQLIVCSDRAWGGLWPFCLGGAFGRCRDCHVLRGVSMSASLIGRPGSSAFRLFHYCSVDVARGLVLLFGLGARALPSWDSKTRWNNLLVDLAVD